MAGSIIEDLRAEIAARRGSRIDPEMARSTADQPHRSDPRVNWVRCVMCHTVVLDYSDSPGMPRKRR